MENLLIEKSEKTPYVEFNINGELRIEGRSIPEDSRAFYQGALNWLHEFRKINPFCPHLENCFHGRGEKSASPPDRRTCRSVHVSTCPTVWRTHCRWL